MAEEAVNVEPLRSRPRLPEEYGMPQSDKGMLPWEWAVERLEKARNYWLATSSPDGRPHAMPVWGMWLDGSLYFDGHPETRWARNLKANPAIAVHIESGDDVVILHGEVEDLPTVDPELAARLVEASTAKYGYSTGADELERRGLFRVRPRVVLAWGEFPKTMTRWRFQ